ncbi:MAG: tRNA (adenosine(37)-N6)-dimethylallyltransferase MiaA [Bacteroidetes bacterium]|jgi:tRNA dimethylallyltransferase|nr:tRNA (adenosine(37)-N6)-dimethylallyltransferase MiaA [Bacteroidota bacterium]
MKLPELFVVGGPTASGKTDQAIALARQLNTEIISFDSRQFYREMHIGTARPLPDSWQGIPHHFLGTQSIHSPLDAATFADHARPVLQQILDTHGSAVLVGGSGFYLQALLYGLDPMPNIPTSIRAEVNQLPLAELQNEVSRIDPIYFKEVDQQNPARLRRALEIWRTVGRPWSEFRTSGHSKKEMLFKAKLNLEILEPERAALHLRIEARTAKMMKQGLKEEALRLAPFANMPVLQTVGYQEWYSNAEASEEEIEQHINAHTRQYARRQITWFKKFKTNHSPQAGT